MVYVSAGTTQIDWKGSVEEQHENENVEGNVQAMESNEGGD
jgi:hypothetical protein